MADKYANMLYADVAESAINTLTFEAINVGLSMFDKVGILIHRLEWYQFDTRVIDDTDALAFGLCSSDGFSTVNSSQREIIIYHQYKARYFGAAANSVMLFEPLIDDLTTLPGGGLLTTPKPLHIFVKGTNVAAVGAVSLRMFFTIISMKPEEYFELLETRTFFAAD